MLDSYYSLCCVDRVPDDVWLVDLDSATITPPTSHTAERVIPPLPEQEGRILKSTLRQVRDA